MNTKTIRNIIKSLANAIGHGTPKGLEGFSTKQAEGYLHSLIYEAAYVYISGTFPDGVETRRAKLNTIGAALRKEQPFILISKDWTGRPFVSFYGTPEELEELKAQEYDLEDRE